jgi:hypothetical protein
VSPPRIARKNCEFRFTPRQLYGSRQPQLPSTFLQSPVRNPNLLRQLADTWPRLYARMPKVDIPNASIEQRRKSIFPSARSNIARCSCTAN